MALQLTLVTPDRALLKMEALSLSLPTADGEVTILPGHAALASLLVPGIARVKTKEGEREIAVSGGFIRVNIDGTVNVLADTAESGEELDLSVIEKAKERAKEVMQKAASADDVSFSQAAAGLQRELARERLVLKRRSKPTPGDQTRIPSDKNEL